MVVLIVGFGSIAKKHLKVLKKIKPDCIIYALRSNRDAETIPDVTNVYSYDEIKFVPDFIIISSPTSNHYDDILNCLRFKCPLFVEKPVLGSLNNSDELMKRIEEAGVIFYVACVLRFHPCIEFIKNNIIHWNRINEVNIYCGSYLPEWRPGSDFRKIYSALPELGGGVHLDLIHELDYSYWLFGMPKKWHSYLSSKSSLAIESIDYANYLLAYTDFNVNIVLNYFRRKPKREIEIVGENLTWTIDLLKYTIKDDENKLIFASENTAIMDVYESQLRYFLCSVESGVKCENDFKSGMDVLKICLLNNYAER